MRGNNELHLILLNMKPRLLRHFHPGRSRLTPRPRSHSNERKIVAAKIAAFKPNNLTQTLYQIRNEVVPAEGRVLAKKGQAFS